jgi:hypothetical protein
MLTLMLWAAAVGTPVEYFPAPRVEEPPASVSAPGDPAKALLEAPTLENARAFLEWREEQARRLQAALEALEAAKREPQETPPAEARTTRPRVRRDLLSGFRR